MVYLPDFLVNVESNTTNTRKPLTNNRLALQAVLF